jgi:hypothetical protein
MNDLPLQSLDVGFISNNLLIDPLICLFVASSLLTPRATPSSATKVKQRYTLPLLTSLVPLLVIAWSLPCIQFAKIRTGLPLRLTKPPATHRTNPNWRMLSLSCRKALAAHLMIAKSSDQTHPTTKKARKRQASSLLSISSFPFTFG